MLHMYIIMMLQEYIHLHVDDRSYCLMNNDLWFTCVLVFPGIVINNHCFLVTPLFAATSTFCVLIIHSLLSLSACSSWWLLLETCMYNVHVSGGKDLCPSSCVAQSAQCNLIGPYFTQPRITFS